MNYVTCLFKISNYFIKQINKFDKLRKKGIFIVYL